jgi:PiT family inorganic phosphate transporter
MTKKVVTIGSDAPIQKVFEYINGFHDTANSIATVVSTKVLTPRQAVIMAAITNLFGALWGTAVAKTISSGLVDTKLVSMSSEIMICALLGAIIWNLITWWFGLPSSSSHALIGGMVGAVLVGYGPDKVIWSGFFYVIASLLISPILGMLAGFFFLKITLYLLVTKIQ